jgi:hypothetical protein
MRSIFIAATATATLFSSPAFTQQPNRSAILTVVGPPEVG